MVLNDVKEITIPEGSVKQIQDSNGNIIWGSESAFPYRRLEYIDMAGKYINLGIRPETGFYFMNTKIDTASPLISSGYGIYFGSAGNYKRLFFQGISSSNEIAQGLKNNSETKVVSYNDINSETMYQFRIRTYNTNNTSGTWWFSLQNIDNNTEVYGKFYNNTSYAMNLAELPYLHINAHAFNSSGSSAVPQNVTVKGNLKFKLYRFYKKANSNDSEIDFDIYPCQRKSDGVIGMYNIINGYFFPCKDTSDTEVIGYNEVVADEYWDLTAPE